MSIEERFNDWDEDSIVIYKASEEEHEKARKAKRLERSLETAIPDEVYEDLSEKISSIKIESEVEQ